jgi:hypothetical protein
VTPGPHRKVELLKSVHRGTLDPGEIRLDHDSVIVSADVRSQLSGNCPKFDGDSAPIEAVSSTFLMACNLWS